MGIWEQAGVTSPRYTCIKKMRGLTATLRSVEHLLPQVALESYSWEG
ncbi:hypothetical protein TAMC210_11310 [Thermanaeromonas sp. C210]|nr:hypothetical protein TAMC210_11310 [Thermanaeromonas sp. C210]